MIPVWAIPERLDQWPGLQPQHALLSAPPDAKNTNSESLRGLLARADPLRIPPGDALRDFLRLEQSITEHGDDAMIAGSQVRAWLTAAFGDLLSGVALTAVADAPTRELIVQEVTARLSDVDSLTVPADLSFSDYGCAILYNTQMTQRGPHTAVGRQGQGSARSHHWAWLSMPQDAGAMKATLQLTGLLLVNEPIFLGLAATMRNGNEWSRSERYASRVAGC